VVLDTNVVGAWSFAEADTRLAQQVKVEILAGRVKAIVPSLFWAEFQQVCKGKLYPTAGTPVPLRDVEAAYDDALAFGLVEVPGELEKHRDRAWADIRRLGLGSYDAYFLALACDLGLDVWTLDRNFRGKVSRDPALADRVKLIGEDILGPTRRPSA
jgi:predicted nucleic acid-binding protein